MTAPVVGNSKVTSLGPQSPRIGRGGGLFFNTVGTVEPQCVFFTVLKNNLETVAVSPLSGCQPAIAEGCEFVYRIGTYGNSCIDPDQDAADYRQQDCSGLRGCSVHLSLTVLPTDTIGKLPCLSSVTIGVAVLLAFTGLRGKMFMQEVLIAGVTEL